MAINVTQSPASNVSANDPIVWKFQFTALGTGTQVKRMIYYLADASNNKIGDDYVWTPASTSEVQPFDAMDVLRGLVSTIWPTVAGAAQTDSNCVKAVKVRYAEATFDTSNCSDTVSAYSDTATVNIWNTALNIDNASALTFTGGKTGFLMNSYPDIMEWSPDSEPYVWFGGIGSVRLTWYNNSGTSLANTTINFTGASTAKYLCIDWRLYGLTTAPATLKLEVNDGTGYITKWIKYSLCSCRDFYTCMNFLDPLGGRSSISLLCQNEISINREAKIVEVYNPTQTAGGTSVLNPKATETLKVQTVLDNTYEGLKYARALFGSPGYHIMRMSDSGTKTWYKFILTAGTTKVIEGKKDLLVELSGYLAEEKSGQSFDI